MIWFKRLAPFILIAAIYFGYQYYVEKTERDFNDQAFRYAEVTARLWLASSTFRAHPDLYISYRDSLLTAKNVKLADATSYLKAYKEHSELYLVFAKRVEKLVDSFSVHQPISLPPQDDSLLEK